MKPPVRGVPWLRTRHAAVSLLLVAALFAGCQTASPRPDATGSPPPVPPGSTPIGSITWRTVRAPTGLRPTVEIGSIAAGPRGYVMAGTDMDLGADFDPAKALPAMKPLVIRSTDAADWTVVNDPDLDGWIPARVAATDEGFVLLAGSLGTLTGFEPASSPGLSSLPASIGDVSFAAFTSPDGARWTKRWSGDGTFVADLAVRGRVVVGLTEWRGLLVSTDAGATWREIAARDAGFGDGEPGTIGVLGSGRWIAAGANGESAAAWWSDDGLHWNAASMESAGPVEGIASVSVSSLAAGDYVALVTGIEMGDGVCDMPVGPGCALYPAAWSTRDGTAWTRLPHASAERTGSMVWGAGPAGVIGEGSMPKSGWTQFGGGLFGSGYQVFVPGGTIQVPDGEGQAAGASGDAEASGGADLPIGSSILGGGLVQSANGWTWSTVDDVDDNVWPTALIVYSGTIVVASPGFSSAEPGLEIRVGTIGK